MKSKKRSTSTVRLSQPLGVRSALLGQPGHTRSAAAQDFYHAVLGWEWHTGRLGREYRFARVNGVPVAGVSAMSGIGERMATWTRISRWRVRTRPCRVARSAGVRPRWGQSRSRRAGRRCWPTGTERCSASGRASWWPAGRSGAGRRRSSYGWHPRRLRRRHLLRGGPGVGVLGPRSCEVRYEDNEVVLRSRGDVVARIHSGAVEAAPDPPSGRTGRSTSPSTTSRPPPAPPAPTAARPTSRDSARPRPSSPTPTERTSPSPAGAG